MEHDNEEGVITFSQIWAVTKKCIARAAIYVVVSVIICFAVLYAVRTITKENYYSSSITFKQSDDGISTTLENNKASAVSAAVNTVFGNADNATEIYETVLSSLQINPYIPEANEDDTDYVATTYTVMFYDLDIDGVSKEQQTSLLEKICTELVSAYSEVSSPDGILTTQAWSYSVPVDASTGAYTLEYLDVVNEVSSRLSTLKSTLNANIAANTAANSKFATYKSTSAEQGRRTATEIVASITNLQTTVNNLYTSILTNAVTNTAATLSGTDYCKATLAIYDAQLSSLEYLRDSYVEQIDYLRKMISDVGVSGTTTGTTVVIDYSAYTSLVEQLMEVEEDIADITAQKADIQLLLDNITDKTTADATAYATANAINMVAIETSIDGVLADVEEILEDYNDLVTEFKEYVMPSSYASVSKSAHAYSSSPLSLMLIIVALVAVAVIAFVVAFGQTWSTLKKSGKMDELTGKKPLPLASGE